jgi:hypothetical protein
VVDGHLGHLAVVPLESGEADEGRAAVPEVHADPRLHALVLVVVGVGLLVDDPGGTVGCDLLHHETRQVATHVEGPLVALVDRAVAADVELVLGRVGLIGVEVGPLVVEDAVDLRVDVGGTGVELELAGVTHASVGLRRGVRASPLAVGTSRREEAHRGEGESEERRKLLVHAGRRCSCDAIVQIGEVPGEEPIAARASRRQQLAVTALACHAGYSRSLPERTWWRRSCASRRTFAACSIGRAWRAPLAQS